MWIKQRTQRRFSEVLHIFKLSCSVLAWGVAWAISSVEITALLILERYSAKAGLFSYPCSHSSGCNLGHEFVHVEGALKTLGVCLFVCLFVAFFLSGFDDCCFWWGVCSFWFIFYSMGLTDSFFMVPTWWCRISEWFQGMNGATTKCRGFHKWNYETYFQGEAVLCTNSLDDCLKHCKNYEQSLHNAYC